MGQTIQSLSSQLHVRIDCDYTDFFVGLATHYRHSQKSGNDRIVWTKASSFSKGDSHMRTNVICRRLAEHHARIGNIKSARYVLTIGYVTGPVGAKFDLQNQPIGNLKLRTGSTR
jgi:hypothetical protein